MAVEQRSEHRYNTQGLKPAWKPGQSGNPSGRPADYAGFRARAREFMSDEGVELLISMARKKEINALRLLAEYAYGKPQQRVDVTGDLGGKVVFQIVYGDQLEQNEEQPALPEGGS
jgi:hypothetical protein